MLSIIVPVYNVEAYLEQCLDSILNQTYTEFEILLIDDGSPDRCGDICDEYADRNKRIRVIHAEHKGLATARNIGIKEARGDYLTFVDSDDWIEAVTLSAMMEAAFSADADIVCIGHWEEEGESKKERRYSFKEYDPKGSIVALISGELGNFSWGKIYRKCLFDNITFPDGKNYEAITPLCRLLTRAKKTVTISEIGYHYQRRENSISKTRSAKNLVDYTDAYIGLSLYNGVKRS